MRGYRIFELSEDGHIRTPPKIFEGSDDRAAVEKARECLQGRPVEVWEGTRLVASLAPINRHPRALSIRRIAASQAASDGLKKPPIRGADQGLTGAYLLGAKRMRLPREVCLRMRTHYVRCAGAT
jgi:hypothetical protein